MTLQASKPDIKHDGIGKKHGYFTGLRLRPGVECQEAGGVRQVSFGTTNHATIEAIQSTSGHYTAFHFRGNRLGSDESNPPSDELRSKERRQRTGAVWAVLQICAIHCHMSVYVSTLTQSPPWEKHTRARRPKCIKLLQLQQTLPRALRFLSSPALILSGSVLCGPNLVQILDNLI